MFDTIDTFGPFNTFNIFDVSGMEDRSDKTRLNDMSDVTMPAWKIKAIEKGVIEDPRISAPHDGDGERPGEEKRKRRPKQTVNLYCDTVPLLRKVESVLDDRGIRSYADIVERLVKEKLSQYEIVRKGGPAEPGE